MFADVRLGDAADLSQLIEELQRDVAVRRVRAALLARPRQNQCDACGDTICAARLAAIPSARRCTDCQTLHESGSILE